MTPQKTCRWEKAKGISPEHPATSRRQFQCIEWDALNRLIKVELKGAPNVTVAEISYDVLNRRVWREADEDQDGTPDEELTYVWDGWRNTEERDYTTEDLLRDYVYGNYIDEVVFGRSDFWDGSTLGPDGDFSDSKEQFYYTTNNLYSVAALVDTSGSVIERYEYLPYGAVTVYTGAGVDSTWFTSDDATSSYSDIQHVTFTGRRSDPESELMYFRNRYYSPELGRFVGRDPIGYGDGPSLYRAYFINQGTDEFGLGLFAPVGETICVALVREFWILNPWVAREIDWWELGKRGRQPCLLDIKCTCCIDECDGAPACYARRGARGGTIHLCHNRIWLAYSYQGVAHSLVHELKHYFDNCAGLYQLQKDCHQSLCREMRAMYAAGQCWTRRSCVNRVMKLYFKGWEMRGEHGCKGLSYWRTWEHMFYQEDSCILNNLGNWGLTYPDVPLEPPPPWAFL